MRGKGSRKGGDTGQNQKTDGKAYQGEDI